MTKKKGGNTSQLGTKENETRATFIVNQDHLKAIKALAYWQRTSIKEVLAEAIEALLIVQKKELTKAVEAYDTKRQP